ncbi:MAG: regulatory protein RecX [Pseudomonadota bacterium]
MGAQSVSCEPGCSSSSYEHESGQAKSDQSATQDLRTACIDLLARREHSCLELRRKMTRKFKDRFSAEQIERAIETLAAEGLQSDLRFTESFTRAKYERGDGPYKIKAALQERGVHSGLIEQALEDEQLDWQRRALLLHRRRFSGVSEAIEGDGESNNEYSEVRLKQRAKEMRFLQSRGFPKDIIYSVLG